MSNVYQTLLAQKKSVSHWLHWILIVISLGLWFWIYVGVCCYVYRHNKIIGYKVEGALLASGDRQQSNIVVTTHGGLSGGFAEPRLPDIDYVKPTASELLRAEKIVEFYAAKGRTT